MTLCFAPITQEVYYEMTNQDLMPIVASNIRMLFDSRPGSRADFARKNFISAGCITRWCRSDLTGIDSGDLKRIADYFGVTTDWIFSPHRTERIPAYEYAASDG